MQTTKVGVSRTLAICAAMLASHPALATGALKPSTPWKVDYGDKECRLLRVFGTGDQAVTLQIERGSGFDSFDMIVVGKSIPKMPRQLPVRLTIEPQGRETVIDGYSEKIPDRPERFVRWYDAKPDILGMVEKNQTVRVSASEGWTVAMQWLGAKDALAALTACHDDLLRGWGLDLALVRAAARPPEPAGSPGRWVTNDDYPDASMRAGREGNTSFLLTVSPAGSVTDCRILSSSSVDELDRAACSLVTRRGKFSPAADAEGKAMQGYYINRVRWQIPR